MKKIVFSLLAGFVTMSASACFAVIAGKNTTKDGSVMFAHDEDDSGEQMLNVYQVPRGAVGDNVKYTWFEFPGTKVADAFINEYGVACASDGCQSREDVEDYTDGGVVYEVRTLIAQKAHSAREAVKLVGDLVTARGYASSGRTYLVADSKEGWMISLVRGRRWVAYRIPDDKVMALPNNYIIDRVDLNDTENFAGSPDLAEYAQKRGWWNPADGPFSFRKAYASPAQFDHPRNYLRQIHALEIISGQKYEENPNTLPICVTPKRKVDKELLMEVLACHFGTPDQPGKHLGGICTAVDILAVIFQLRSDVPVEIGAMGWVAAGHPCIEVFLPWYSGMTKSPEGFCRYATAKEAVDKHFTDAEDKQVNYPDAKAWIFTDRWKKANTTNYDNVIGDITARNKKFQKKWFAEQVKFEASLKKYYDPKTGRVTNRVALEKALNDFTAKAYREYFKMLSEEKL